MKPPDLHLLSVSTRVVSCPAGCCVVMVVFSPFARALWRRLRFVLPSRCGGAAPATLAVERRGGGGSGDDGNEKHEKNEWCHEASALIHLGLSRMDQLHHLTLSQGKISNAL